MSKSEGSSDEAIGRPKDWQEGRYERAGQPVDKSVIKPNEEASEPPDTTSTRVTEEDYSKR